MDIYVIVLYNSDIMISDKKYFEITFCSYIKDYHSEIDVTSDSYELQYVASGGVGLEYQNQRFELEGGSFWINLPGIRYRYRPLDKYGSWEHRFVVFAGEVCEFWEELDLFPKNTCSVSPGLDFADRLDQIIALSAIDSPMNRLESRNMIEKILVDLKRSKMSPRERMSDISAIMSEIDVRNELLSGPPDYAAIASKHGMTRRTLFRRFQKATGVTPHTYHLKTRIQHITALLENTDIPLKEIARKAGYADIFYFTRQFKQLTGTTPGQCRSQSHEPERR